MKEHKNGCPMIVTGWAASIPRYCTCGADEGKAISLDKNGHNVNEKGELTHDKECYGCHAPQQQTVLKTCPHGVYGTGCAECFTDVTRQPVTTEDKDYSNTYLHGLKDGTAQGVKSEREKIVKMIEKKLLEYKHPYGADYLAVDTLSTLLASLNEQ